jgi:hypothetical protein
MDATPRTNEIFHDYNACPPNGSSMFFAIFPLSAPKWEIIHPRAKRIDEQKERAYPKLAKQIRYQFEESIAVHARPNTQIVSASNPKI